jgi:hypothetical protein
MDVRKAVAEWMALGADAVVVLTNERTGQVAMIPGRNIVTDAGDTWYAQKACGETPTNDFANLFLATAGPATPGKTDNYGSFTVVAGSSKAKSTGYPQTNDTDTDNTGAAVDTASWKFEYGTADGPFSAITHSFIAASGASGTDPILNSYKWAASWDKDSSTSAKVFANHNMLGS